MTDESSEVSDESGAEPDEGTATGSDANDSGNADDPSGRVTRRSALAALGLAGLLGIGATAASADPQGQVGTSSDPVEQLFTQELRSPSALKIATGGGAGDAGNIVAGHPSNSASPAVGATIAGGGHDGNTSDPNVVSGVFCTIGGGRGNTAEGNHATVGGGYINEAIRDASTVGGGSENVVEGEYGTIAGGGPSDPDASDTNNVVYDDYGTIGGGGENQAGSDTETASFATVGGGNENTASDTEATVGGGRLNEATGLRATVPGGYVNTADGACSFAAGRQADTNGNDGAFVWGDHSFDDVTASADDEFVVQAGGGVTIYTDSDTSTNTGAELPAGSGSWSSLSARAAKSNVDPVEPASVLDGVESLDLATWEYDAEANATHMGPMAEDFHDAFGLGHDEHRISTVDADGVAFAAIQGICERLDDVREELADRETAIETQRERIEAQTDRIGAQANRVDQLEAENDALRERLDVLEERVLAQNRGVGQ